MGRAIGNAETVRGTTAPNPWVGALVLGSDGKIYDGATRPPGGLHAERIAIDLAGAATRGATLVTTLEPCCHEGRTSPCVDHIIEAGLSRVVVGVEDPDPRVVGNGLQALRDAGLEVVLGVERDAVEEQLEPYLHQRKTGTPWVVLKIALTLDGRIAAADGSSEWITSDEARRDAHSLRARCDAVLVGAGTVRADNPSLTTRLVSGSNPQRIVLGKAPDDAAVHPCWEIEGDLEGVLNDLSDRGVIDLLVEGGSSVAAQFHREGLVNEYIFYLAPALTGGNDGRPVFEGAGSATMADLWRGSLRDVRKIGTDVRVEFRPREGD